ncbi:hypothetical protein Tco_0727921 [Tanacetum coccineum]|uniref:Pentatricopeptide repeat-containing protein n=1 Tax=Tanacetum coccineum TaxID=301880 RepID=A0ABQ4YM09_9ASTR
MPRATSTDISLTKSYIPKVSKIPGISPTIAKFYKSIENRNIHEGRVVDQAYYKSNNIERLFTNIRFDCLFKINEPIVPRFILDFYSQVTVQTDEYGYLVISFMIQHEFITLTLAQFGQILKIPYNGQAVFTNEWDLGSLEYSQETEGPYSTDLPTPDDIRRLLELERVMVDRTIKSQTVTLTPNQILTKELSPDMKQWEELIRENVFGLGGHRDHLPACLAHMLYCVVAEEQYNLAYFFVKRIECARANPTANLPYGMFLTRLYRHIMEVYPILNLTMALDIVDRVMHTIPPSTNDDDDDDVETSRASTPSPTTYLNSLGPLKLTKTTKCLPLPNKPMKLSLNDNHLAKSQNATNAKGNSRGFKKWIITKQDRKPSQNEKTEHGNGKTVQKSRAKVQNVQNQKSDTEESAVKPETRTEKRILLNSNLNYIYLAVKAQKYI